MGLAHVDEHEIGSAVAQGLQLFDRDLGNAGSRSGGLRQNAAEGFVVDEPGYRRVRTTNDAVRILLELQLPKPYSQSVDQEKPADERIAAAKNQLDRLGGLNDAEKTRKDSQNAPFGARGNETRGRRLGVETAIAGTFCRPEDGRLPFESEDRGIDVGLTREDAGVVDQISRGKVVGAVRDDVEVAENLERVLRRQSLLEREDVRVRIQVAQARRRGRELGPAHVACAEENLTLQIRIVHDVEIDQADRADAGRGEIQSHRRAQPARSDREDASGFELLLALEPDLRHDQVARVAADLVVGQSGYVPRRRGDGSSGDRGNDRERIGLPDRRRFLLKVADVFVVLVDVDEAAQPPRVVEEMLLQTLVAVDEGVQRRAHGRRRELDARRAPGVWPERRRKMNLHASPP